uniref:Mediator of RNA polymerase II transcription subunit 7 n=1 Tax=Trichuris muris TaxID=70415 RepID=A0A5S6QQK5_TRIMR
MNDRANLVSSFPSPPIHYISQYTDKNVEDGMALPPPAPIQGTYSMFGAQYSTDEPIVQPLESQCIRRLYPTGANFDRKQELKKLNHSIVANFLDLVELLIRCPSSPERERKIEDLNLLFINFHHLINEYRPHQARETLKLMLEVQCQQRLTMVRRFQTHFDAVASKLACCLDSVPENLEISFMNDAGLTKIWNQCFQCPETVEMQSVTEKSPKAREADPSDLLLCHLADEMDS